MTLQQQIIKALGAKPQINAEEEIRRSVDFLKSYLQTYPFIKSLVLGISGGQDSTLAGKLCQMAINELRQETGNESLQFIAVRLPYGVQADEQDCQDAIAFIQPDRVLTVNIKGAVLASEQALREAGIELSDFVRGNEKARERMKSQTAYCRVASLPIPLRLSFPREQPLSRGLSARSCAIWQRKQEKPISPPLPSSLLAKRQECSFRAQSSIPYTA